MVLADDGTVYSTSENFGTAGNLVARDSSSNLLWQFTLPPQQPTHPSGPTIGADGTVYFPTATALYALKGSAPIKDSAWPIYGGNVRGTWRVQELPKVPALPSQAILRGGTLVLNGTATGPLPIHYRWMRDGRFLPGETNATLTVTNLRGLDGGTYQVRVSNPTGDRLSQPAHVKVSLDPLLFAGVSHNLDEAFTNSPPSGNTRREVWQFFHGINETNRNGRYAAMPFYTNLWQAAGLEAWSSSATASNVVGRSTSSAAVEVLGASVPPGGVFLNPGSAATNCVALGYQAEVTGIYAVTGRLGRLAVDATGDGVRWHLDVASANVRSGALTNDADSAECTAPLYVNRGEFIYLILSPADGNPGDLTGVEFEVRLVEPDANSEPGILQSPQNLTVVAGVNASFSTVVDGEPSPSLQWQRSLNNGATWENLIESAEAAGVNSTNLQLYSTSLEMNGQMFRVEALNSAGSALSSPATLTVTNGPNTPLIVLQPEGLFLLSGNKAVLRAEASGSGPFYYQWWHEGVLLQNQTNAALILDATTASNSGGYYVVVSNLVGSVTSQVATITVDQPPPSPILALLVSTNGPDISLSSQPGTRWKVLRSASVRGPWEALARTTISSNGTAWVRDMNPQPGRAFYRARLDIPPTLPEIEVQPQSRTCAEGTEGGFSVQAVGAAPLSYQWWKGSEPLVGETRTTLLISGVISSHGGDYTLVVSNDYGSITSEVATLTVVPPAVGRTPNVFATATSELSALRRYASNAVNGVRVDSDFWESTEVDRDPAITFDLQGVYRLDQFTLWNSHEPGPAIKRMRIEHSIDGQTYRAIGEQALASGTATEEPSDFVDLNGIVARFIRFDILENYAGQVFPFTGVPTNNPLVAIDEVEFRGELVATGTLSITDQPQHPITNLVGVTPTLGVGVLGTPPFSYQWWKNGQPLTGATNQTVTLAPLTPADAGSYYVIVSNAAGSFASQVAPIVVSTNVTTLGGPVAGLLAFLPFNANPQDISGNGRHGVVQGPVLTTDRFGVFGGAYKYVGNQTISIPNLDPDNYASAFSFGCWISPQQASGAPAYWLGDAEWGSTFMALGFPFMTVRLGSGDPSTEHSVGGINLPPGQWQHLFVTHDPSVDRVYMNGIQVGQWPSLPLSGNVSTLLLGHLGFKGAIDEFAVFGQGLTTNEVANLYASGISSLATSAPTIRIHSVASQNSNINMSLSGIPGSAWTLERALSITGPWTNVVSLAIGTNGLSQFQDTNPPAGSGFYRAKQP